MLIDKSTLVSQLAPPLDGQLAQQFVDEFVSQERRFIQRDWEPSQLDGGQFCEISARIIHHMDSGNLNANKSVDDCLGYVESEKNNHALHRQTALHIAKVIRTAYKFRSARGAVHISPSYKANHMDSKFVLESVRWLFAEMLRLWWNDDREKVAKAIRELLQFDVPSVGRFGESVLLVQRIDLSATDEILVLLHYAGEQGFSRRELGQYVMHAPPRVTEAINFLTGSKSRQIVKLPSGTYRLTDLGSKYVRERLTDKLFL